MSRYSVPKRIKKYNTKVSRKTIEEGSLVDNIKRLIKGEERKLGQKV